MKDILLNLLFILVVLFLTLFIIDGQRNKLNQLSIKFLIYLSSFVSILFCMTYSISINDHFIFDIRVIPYIVGSLFGGPIVTIGLYLSIFFYRFILDFGWGLFGSAINYGLLAILLYQCSKNFLSQNTKQKAIITILMVLAHLIFSYGIYTYIFVSGTPLSLYLQTALIKFVGTIFIVLITEGIFRQQMLRHQLEGIEKMELVSHLSASISHEVRNGLTSAHGFFQLLKERETDPQKFEYIRIALDELNRTESIIRDFLTFAKPTPKFLKEIDMEQLINHTLVLVEPLANMNSIEIQKNLSPFYIKGDENLIQQSLINIFKNAIEAMPNGGILEINMISTPQGNRLMIRDTGVGMTRKQIERLGTPYYTTKGQKGTGLGMMVAYRIIHDLNGRVEVDSEVGKGTTFHLYFPPYLD